MAGGSLVEAARELRGTIEAHADDGERLRRLPMPTVKALADAELMRMCVPAVYGGPEADPMTMVEAIETVARRRRRGRVVLDDRLDHVVDGGFLPAARRGRSTATGPSITGGVFAPNGHGAAARRNGVDGFEVTGRWAWGSGTQHCRWVLGGAIVRRRHVPLCWLPQSDVTFHDTWHTSGMRGSGSLDFSVDAAFVPADRTSNPA